MYRSVTQLLKTRISNPKVAKAGACQTVKTPEIEDITLPCKMSCNAFIAVFGPACKQSNLGYETASCRQAYLDYPLEEDSLGDTEYQIGHDRGP